MLILDCSETVQMCCNIRPFLKILRLVISIIQWSVPLLLVALGTYDIFKAVVSNDEKAIKDSQSTFIKRLLYGLIVFLVPFLVTLIFSIFADNVSLDDTDLTSAEAWVVCWEKSAHDDMDGYCDGCEDIYSN